MSQDRYGATIRGQHILHATLQRDWRCGTCGGKLTTRFFPDVPNWRTVCMNDASHDDQEFVHDGTWAYIEARRMAEAAKAQDVFVHLPEDVQTAIEGA